MLLSDRPRKCLELVTIFVQALKGGRNINILTLTNMFNCFVNNSIPDTKEWRKEHLALLHEASHLHTGLSHPKLVGWGIKLPWRSWE